MTCSISLLSVGTDHSPMDFFTVSNLTAAGIRPGSTCIVDGLLRLCILL